MNDDKARVPALSIEGEARRARMLDELLGAMRHRQDAAARRRRTAVIAAPCAAIAVAVIAIVNRPRDEGGAAPAVVAGQPDEPNPVTEAGREQPRVVVVHTDAVIMDRYRPQPRVRAEVIDDDGLIEALRESRREAGIIRVGDRTTLTRAVTDAELERAGSGPPAPALRPPA